MSDFVPRPVLSRYDIDIVNDRLGHWTARDRDGLTGGTFFTREEALRFALTATGRDHAHVHVRRCSRPTVLRQ